MPINPRLSGKSPELIEVERQIREITEHRDRLLNRQANLNRLITRGMMRLTRLEKTRTKLSNPD